MLIFGIIGVVGVVNVFILWCCCKVGKESDKRLEILLKEDSDLDQSIVEREGKH